MKRVYVRWVDSCQLGGSAWTARDELDTTKGETVCESIGWLVDENDHSLYVAGHISPEEYGSVWQIPRVAVKELNYLETDEADDSDSPSERGTGVHDFRGLGTQHA